MKQEKRERKKKKKSFTAFSLFVHVVAFLNIHCIFLKIISTSLVCYIIDSIVPGAILSMVIYLSVSSPDAIDFIFVP